MSSALPVPSHSRRSLISTEEIPRDEIGQLREVLHRSFAVVGLSICVSCGHRLGPGGCITYGLFWLPDSNPASCLDFMGLGGRDLPDLLVGLPANDRTLPGACPRPTPPRNPPTGTIWKYVLDQFRSRNGTLLNLRREPAQATGPARLPGSLPSRWWSDLHFLPMASFLQGAPRTGVAGSR